MPKLKFPEAWIDLRHFDVVEKMNDSPLKEVALAFEFNIMRGAGDIQITLRKAETTQRPTS